MFISINVFCIRWMALLACATTPARWRHNVRIARTASLGWKLLFNNPKSVQLQQPLAFCDIALAPRQILGVPRIHQIYFQAALL
jgi:hypothetical protein